MLSQNLTNVMLIIFPPLMVIIGSYIGLIRSPSQKSISIIQHFTAGLVLAAVAKELLPEINIGVSPFTSIIGFSAGVALMIGIKTLIERIEEKNGVMSKSSKPLIAAVGVDMVVDGLLVGTSTAIGIRETIIITIALTIEVFFLSLSTSSSMAKNGIRKNKGMLISLFLSIFILVGILIGRLLSSQMTGSLLTGTLAFASSALLYLVIEELLFEAHKKKDTKLGTIMFFIGFFIIFLLEA